MSYEPFPSDPNTSRTPDLSDAELRELEDYAAWVLEENPEPEPYPNSFVLDETAFGQKAALGQALNALLQELASDEVQSRAHYGPGGPEEAAQKMRTLQADVLPRIYANVRFETPHLRQHVLQETPTWCQIASVCNALTALGYDAPSQQEVAAAKRVHPNGRPFPADMRDFLHENHLQTRDVVTVAQMMNALIVGDKAILNMGYPAYPMAHTVLVSGVRVEYGKIDFLMNDSDGDGAAQAVPLARMLQLLQPPFSYNTLNRSYVVSDRSADQE